jgi:molybdenum cofactor cytidylyltransferase
LKFTGIILAAGASSRMGSPKALLRYQGETFVDRLTKLFAPFCEAVIVVLGYQADVIEAGAESGIAQFVRNLEPQRGQFSSLQCGLHAVRESSEGILFLPVDCPTVQASTVARLIGAFGTHPFVIPQFRGKHGHPILFRREVLPEFLGLDAQSTAREVVHRYSRQTRYVDVDDPGILRDVDDPAAYRELVQTVSGE